MISVVIPAYNEEDYLPRCLEALKRQDYRGDVEIIVVDNNSTDATAAIAREAGARVIHEPRQGVVYAKRAGCDHARGEVIAVLDADNVPPVHWLSRIVELLKNPQVVAVTGPYFFPIAPWWVGLHHTCGNWVIQTWQSITGSSPHVAGGNVAFRRGVYRRVGGYDTRFTYAGDEVQIRRDLQRAGFILFNLDLTVVSSTRRFKKGALYFYIECLLIRYILNYLFTLLFDYPLRAPENLREEITPRP